MEEKNWPELFARYLIVKEAIQKKQKKHIKKIYNIFFRF